MWRLHPFLVSVFLGEELLILVANYETQSLQTCKWSEHVFSTTFNAVAAGGQLGTAGYFSEQVLDFLEALKPSKGDLPEQALNCTEYL